MLRYDRLNEPHGGRSLYVVQGNTIKPITCMEAVRSSVMPKGVEHNKPGPEALEIISHTERR